MIRTNLVTAAKLLVAASLVYPAIAGTFNFNFVGPGVSGTVALTYGPGTDMNYPQALEVTGISGTFSDSNNGLNLVNAPIGALVPITRDTPESDNHAAPNDFSRFAVAAGLGPNNNGFLTYDNLFWPGGSPPTATSYPLHGGFLDIYGLMFQVGDKVVNFWSGGTPNGIGTGPIYGVAVATHDSASDYVGSGVTVTPEPSGLVLLSGGLLLLGLLGWRQRTVVDRSV